MYKLRTSYLNVYSLARLKIATHCTLVRNQSVLASRHKEQRDPLLICNFLPAAFHLISKSSAHGARHHNDLHVVPLVRDCK